MSTRLQINELALEGLRYSYGRPDRPAVDGVSLKINAGECLAIVGPNGCGKSTLLRLIVGELHPSAGRVLIDNTETDRLGRLKIARRIAMVPQQMAGGVGFGYSAREMVLMSRYAAHGENGILTMGFENADDARLANEFMWAADVHHLADRSVTTLSGGERQRVAIARAFAQDTPALLLDEPTSSLDLFHQLELLDQLRRMTSEEHRIVILVTHDLNLAARHASRIVLMDQGKVVADGTPQSVLTPAVLEPVYRVKVHVSPPNFLTFSKLPEASPHGPSASL